MAIIIRHLAGPLAGQEQRFDDGVEFITFGRSPDCDVVYPLEYTVVSRRHFELKRTSAGGYEVMLFGNHFVELDGVLVDAGAPVRSGTVISLGGPAGPCFKVMFRTEMAEIACAPYEASEDDSDSLPHDPLGPADAAVDLLFKRKSFVPAAVAGLAVDIAASSIPPWRPEGIGAAPSPIPDYLGHDRPTSRPSETRFPQAPRAEMQTRMQMRRSSGLFWWVAIALGVAVIGYLLYRREVVLGAMLGKLLPAAAPPPPAPAKPGDLVDVSVFGPTSIEAGGEGLIQVFLHTLSQREIAKVLAKEADPDATRRGIQTLAAEIALGQRVEIILEGRGLGIDQEMQTLIWRGEPCSCQFTISAPEDLVGRDFHPRAIVLVDSVPVGSLSFALKVTRGKTSNANSEPRGDRARRYAYAFLSYASHDRAEVIKRAQGLKAGGTNFFNDLLSLEPGERWEKRLYQEIDRCDVFYLFWSSQAKDSEWVLKETEYALARRAASGDETPDIIPVIIEGPPPPARPELAKGPSFQQLSDLRAGRRRRRARRAVSVTRCRKPARLARFCNNSKRFAG